MSEHGTERHGTTNGYAVDRCRCDLCRKAWREYMHGLRVGKRNADVTEAKRDRALIRRAEDLASLRSEATGELAVLMAEQERDAASYHIAFPRERSLDRSVTIAAPGGRTLADVVGTPDAEIVELLGMNEGHVRRIPRPQVWTHREIVKHIRAWAKEYGAPPDHAEWTAPRGRGFPSSASLARKFGTFNNAIRAAGFEPRKVGGCTPQPVKTGLRGRKRVRKQKRTSRITSAQLKAAYVLYDRKKVSMVDLAALLWEKYGYPSPVACQTALNKGFHAEGFRLRTKSEARMCLSQEKRREIARAMAAGRAARRPARKRPARIRQAAPPPKALQIRADRARTAIVKGADPLLALALVVWPPEGYEDAA